MAESYTLKLEFTPKIPTGVVMLPEILSTLAAYRKQIDSKMSENPKGQIVFQRYSDVDTLTIEDWIESKKTLPSLPPSDKLMVLFSVGYWYFKTEEGEGVVKLFEKQLKKIEDMGLADRDGNIILKPHEVPKYDIDSYKARWLNYVNFVLFGYMGYNITVRRVERIIEQEEIGKGVRR